MSPLFSVVIPVYNRAEELRRAIQSVLEQSDQDFEIIVVDDGSADRPEQVVADISDQRVQIHRQDNQGGAFARNAGIDLSRGRFIAFLDSDDCFLPDHLAAMRKLLEGTRDTVGYARVVVERGEGRAFLKPPRAIADGEHMATYLLAERGFVPTVTTVVSAEWARRVRYDENLSYAQDTDFCIRLFLAGCRFVMAEEPGAVWNDSANVKRVSAGRKGARMIAWLEALRARIPPRAYYGARGWMIAKGVVRNSVSEAIGLYAGATLRGCYSPRLALVVFLQIFFPDTVYRALADCVIGGLRGAVWSRAERMPRRAMSGPCG